jgi:alkylhydroperoxidase family enzyme
MPRHAQQGRTCRRRNRAAPLTLYSERERIAFAWAEELTALASPEAVSDALYEQARQHFDEDALVDLTLLVVTINSWNRLNIAARTIGGHYKPPSH